MGLEPRVQLGRAPGSGCRAFYTGLLALGLRDAYRELNPSGGDHSWISLRFGSQRLDHTLLSVGAGEIRTCGYDHTTRGDDLSDHAALLTTIGAVTRPCGDERSSPVVSDGRAQVIC